MKVFTSKEIWQKILVLVLIIFAFQFATSQPVHAMPGDTLLEPVTSLFANLGDGIMNIMQKTIMKMETSGAWVEESSGLWAKILVIAAAIVAATIAVASVILSGGAALSVIVGVASAVIKIGMGAAVAFFAVTVTHFGSEGFYLPEYKLTPQAIFENKILAFDVNFFNPKKNKITTTKKTTKKFTDNDYAIGYEVWKYEKNDNTGKEINSGGPQINSENIEFTNSVKKDTTPDSVAKQYMKNIGEDEKNLPTATVDFSMVNGKKIEETVVRNAYNSDYTGYYATLKTYNYKFNDGSKLVIKWYTYYMNGWVSPTSYKAGNTEETETVEEYSSARELQSVVASWYKAFRNLALVALLSILVYIGIRIVLSSTAGDKAKYKQMLTDWVVALCLVFLMHYIMSFAVTINEKFIEVVSSITTNNLGSVDDFVKTKDKDLSGETNSAEGKDKDGNNLNIKTSKGKFTDVGTELFVIEGEDAKRAYKVLVGDDGEEEGSGAASNFITRFEKSRSDHSLLYWPAQDFMTQARIKGQLIEVDKDDNETEIDDSQTAVTRAGYNIIYVVLVIYTVIFCFTYLKRVIYMAFLTIIAPLVAATYPIDKINDGKAQAFDLWLKEYVFNLLIQPMHLILYTVLVGSAMRFASNNIFYVVIALGFLTPAEKLLRRFFGFEKAQTPGMFGGPAGSAIMMTGLSKLMHPKPPKGMPRPGENNSSKDSENKIKTAPINKKIDDPDSFLGIGNNQDKETDKSIPEFSDKLTDEQKDKLKLAQTGKEEALDGMKNANTVDEKKEYEKLANSYENDINGLRNPEWVKDNNNGIKFASSNSEIGNNIPRITNNNLKKQENKPKDSKSRRRRRALRRALEVNGKKKNRYYGMSNGQVMAELGKKATGFAAKTAGIGIGATAAGLASISGGDPSKAVQNMIATGTAGYVVGKGIESKIDNVDIKDSIKEAKKGYYGDEYEEIEQEKYKKQFAKDKENLRKIEDKLKIDRKEAKKVAEKMAEYTDKEGINSLEDTMAIYQMTNSGYTEKEAIAAASYNNIALDGKDTRHMKAKDKNDYKTTYKERIKKKKGINEDQADTGATNLFNAMDMFNQFKN